MGLFKRISDIISANLGEMAESYEDPEKMLKQAIREMDESIAEAAQATVKAMASEKKLAKELAHNQSEAKAWQTRAEKAVEQGDDELARKALVRKQEYTNICAALQDQIKASNDASEVLRHQLDAMKAKQSEAKRNLATLSARHNAAVVRKKTYTQMQDGTKFEVDDTAFDKFERLRDRVESVEAEAEAMAELQGYDSSSDPEDGSGEDDIEDQLAKLKQKKSEEAS